jgi:hypothetical protein
VLPVFSVSVCHGRTIPLRGFHLKQPDVRRVFLVDRDGSVRLAEERSPDVTTRIGSNKRGEQTREPARQHAVAQSSRVTRSRDRCSSSSWTGLLAPTASKCWTTFSHPATARSLRSNVSRSFQAISTISPATSICTRSSLLDSI